jgi:Zn-dependent M16 (insulinase) family peptidase
MMCVCVSLHACFVKTSFHYFFFFFFFPDYDVSMFEQEKLCAEIMNGDDDLLSSVTEKLNDIRTFLMTHVDDMFAQVSIPHRCDEYDLDFEVLHDSFEEAILAMRSKESPPKERLGVRRWGVYPNFDEMQNFTRKNMFLVENVGVDSNYLDVFMPYPIQKSDEDFYPLLMACAVLSASDIGPLFRRVRGSGTAYYVSLNYSMWWGNVYFSVEETSDPVQAIQSFIETIEDYAGRDTIDRVLMESARSTLIFEQFSAQSIPAGIIERDFTSYAQNMTPDEACELEKRLAIVTEKDVIRVIRKMLTQINGEKYVHSHYIVLIGVVVVFLIYVPSCLSRISK